jgi:hypothetical protein
MSDWMDPEDDEYFAEIDPDAELTGKEPKFVQMEGLTHHPVALSEMKVDDLVKLYIDARNQLATDTKGYKARHAKVKGHMEIISMILRDRGEQLGVDSFATASGTAFKHKKETFKIENWEEFTTWLDTTKNFQALQKRVSPNAIKEIREEDGLPPGLSCLEITEFSVRSPSARKKKS